MAKNLISLERLAAAGRRWFAQPPEGFEEPTKTAMIAIASEAQNFTKSSIGEKMEEVIKSMDMDEAVIMLTYSHVLQNWLKQNGITIFVSPEMMEACEQTDVMDCVEGSDIKTVHQVGYLSLPKEHGFRSSQTGDVVRHIFFEIFEEGQPLPFYLNGKLNNKLHPPGRRLFMQAYWRNSSDCSSYSLPLDIKGKSLLEVLNETRGSLSFGLINRLNDEEKLRLEARDLGLWMGSLVTNLCLIMQSYPSYVRKLSEDKSIRQSFRDKNAPVSLIIHRAREAKVHQEIIVRDLSKSDPTGKTRELKKRKGHWRRQPHGDRFELENPEVQIIILDDGRHAHMKWLQPWLNPNLFEVAAKSEQHT